MASATRPFHTRNPGLPGRCVDTPDTVHVYHVHAVSDLSSPEYPRALVVYDSDSFLLAPTLGNLSFCPSVVFKQAPSPRLHYVKVSCS